MAKEKGASLSLFTTETVWIFAEFAFVIIRFHL